MVWNVENELAKLEPLKFYCDHEDEVTDISISSDMGLFASCSIDGSINLYLKSSF